MKLLTTTDAAARLGLTVQRVHQLIKDGSLRAEKLGRDYVIDEADLTSVTYRRPVGRPPKAASPPLKPKPRTARTKRGTHATGKSRKRKTSKA